MTTVRSLNVCSLHRGVAASCTLESTQKYVRQLPVDATLLNFVTNRQGIDDSRSDCSRDRAYMLACVPSGGSRPMRAASTAAQNDRPGSRVLFEMVCEVAFTLCANLHRAFGDCTPTGKKTFILLVLGTKVVTTLATHSIVHSQNGNLCTQTRGVVWDHKPTDRCLVCGSATVLPGRFHRYRSIFLTIRARRCAQFVVAFIFTAPSTHSIEICTRYLE
jgi:hypothetical protein